MADNPLISLMLEVNISIKDRSEKNLISVSGGVKEEQVLDAFKILFNDNQVN
jgi:hypothetical protein